jgi:hypothetical protein
MDALSLSHLTYCDATITVNFHRLDHPPFPCTRRLLRPVIEGKYLAESRRQYIRCPPAGITSQVVCHPKDQKHETTYYHRHCSHPCWNHRLRHWRAFFHAREESGRSGFCSDFAKDTGHCASLADLQHCLACGGHCSGFRWGESKVTKATLLEISSNQIDKVFAQLGCQRSMPVPE